MANKGETKTQKSLSAPKSRYFSRKVDKFTTKSKAGTHRKKDSVPLSFALRQLLEVVANAREAKKILGEGKVKVNAIARKDERFALGLFDLIELAELKKKYRVVLDEKGRLILREIDAKSKDFKISKVTGKRAIKGGKILLTTNDGFTIDPGKAKVGVDDSIKISLPEIKIDEVYPMAKGSTIFIIGGTHVGETAMVEDVMAGSLQRKRAVLLSSKDNQYQTVTRNVFVVGKAKSEIEALTQE
ncbi:MAG: hypothetical protein NUV67_00775 [archaeon]|nr:hypothetical protein [archaeon]